MSKLEQNKEQKRQAILKAAQEAFFSEGYIKASINRIASQASVTKQTLYRYYPSKSDLFRAVLLQMGEKTEFGFLEHLQKEDTRQALYNFAFDFIRAHLSDEHLAAFRLLVTESAVAPEITRSFCDVGPDEVDTALAAFFADRFGIRQTETLIQLWTGMLLSYRSAVLTGASKPDEEKISQIASEATDFLLAGITSGE